MLRFLEVVLFLSPVFAYAAWRLLGANAPSPRFLGAAAAALLLIGIALYWFSRTEALPPDTTYAPAELRDGRLVPGRAVAR